VQLRAADPALLAAPANALAASAAALLPRPVLPERQFRVLVAEDNRTNQMVAAGMLAMNGCVCEFAADGVEAVRAAQRERFDLILMDCSMPEMDGYEATAHIRLAELALGRRTPLVAMTANTQVGDAEKCLAAGMDDYLAKPITLVELRQKLEKWLPHGGLPAAPAHTATRGGNTHQSNHAGPSPVDPAVFDKLREVLGDTLPHAITPYLEDTPGCLDELEQAVHAGDMDTARARAHALKGSSGNFGADTLAGLAFQAEQFAAAREAAQIVPLLAPLRAHYETLAAFLHGEISGVHTDVYQSMDDTPQVLVVDDDRSTRSTLRHTLQRDGFRVEEAADGAQALAMLARFQPDVILMDAMMPVMDGFTACARMQELPNGGDVPVLMITALQDNSSVERAFAAGASDYIPKPIHYAVLSQRVRRIIEANRAEKRIRHLAYNDVLTNLPNRTLFFELLGKSVELAGQEGRQVGVLFMDLDRFKYVNDNLGHHVGDRLLQAVAKRVRAAVRGDDIVARLGGDEFTVILNELDSPAAAATAAHNIVRTLAAPFPVDGHDIFVTASVGIAMYPHDGGDVATLVKHADSAMYRAKRTSSGFQFYEPSMEHSISEHVRLESDLRRALEQRQQLEVHYQPQASLADGRIIGMEALVRWRIRPGHDRADRIHPAGRGNRFDQSVGRLGAAHRLRATAGVHPRWPAAATGGGQPVGAPVAAKGFRRFCGSGAGRHRSGAAPAGTGDHRKHLDGERPGHADRAAPPAFAGRAAVDRRFRHRLFVVVLSETLPGRHHQDRPLFRARRAAGCRRHGNRHRHHCAGAQPAPGSGGRGRGNRGATGVPARPQL
jgi:diguanylate cyclase (GGDEF)-like protein